MVAIQNLVTGALLVIAAAAQIPTTNFSMSDIQTLVSGTGPSSPNAATKVDWCKGQTSLCGTLCNGVNTDNHCSSTDLTWSCKCSNGSAPALQYYPTSMIGFECHALLGNCLAAHANDQASQDACKRNYVCGNATNANAMDAANAASSASTTTMATSAGTAAATGAAAPSSSTHAGAAAVATYAPGALAMAIIGALGYAL